MNATRKLAALDKKLADAKHRERELADGQRQAEVEQGRLRQRLVEVFEEGDDIAVDGTGPAGSEAAKVHAELAKADARVAEPWAQKIEAARRRIQRAGDDRARFVIDNLGDLADARREEAEAAATELEAWLEGAEAVVSHWHELARWYTDLLVPVPGVTGQDLPMLNVDSLRSEIQRVQERGIPAPLPRSLYPADDPTIRSAA